MPTTLDTLPPGIAPDLADTLDRLASVASALAWRIARGGLDGDLAAGQGTNADGDSQKALDVIADDSYRAALADGAVRHYASEEQDDVCTLNPAGTLAVAIDPLDGSSNIDTNVSIGTIFGIYPAAADPSDSFLRPGRDLLAAGYAIFGPQCCFMVCAGGAVLKYVLDPATRRFARSGEVQPIPRESTEYAINASNYRHWPAPIRAYVDDRVAGSEGPTGRNFNMRWIASLVAETHRILTRGGIFLYPADSRKGYESGRLRLVYECAPIAFLVEAAGGMASTGTDRILDIVPERLHARTPFVFGSANKVSRVATYHDLPAQEISALFNKRGLFRGQDS
ncbi:MAG: class 1 fructose-bisphosphatase [Gemmobacter sp.]|uniref:class 1 fructose-bisphosphatase n=1 Tax=Gemmobacter sp. TaxID=1898957 RepID=UPI00391CE087